MKIQIFNFGPIKKFDFDLDKDLIVIYGKNNIGKSYALSIVYLLLKNLNQLSKIQYYLKLLHNSSISPKKVLEIEKRIVEDKKKSVNIIGDLQETICQQLYDLFGKNLEQSFSNTFGELSNLSNKNSRDEPLIKIEFRNVSFDLIIGSHIRIENFSIGIDVLGKYSEKNISFKRRSNKIYVYTNKNTEIFNDTIDEVINLIISMFISETGLLANDLLFLPASRSGIYVGMSAFGQIVAELSKNRALLTKKIELPGISEPISDYFIRLSEMKPQMSNKTIFLQKKGFVSIANEIENSILKGEVSFDNNKKALLYSPYTNPDLKFEMNFVSSMVSEISPIVAFIKYSISRPVLDKNIKGIIKPIIFIEEPEAHLHPEAQVKLIEVFVKLIEQGIKLIVTSHSNYIFNKLNNLIIGENLSYEKYCPILLEGSDQGSVGKIMDIDDFGVEDENFLDISEDLFDEREILICQRNIKNDDTTDK